MSFYLTAPQPEITDKQAKEAAQFAISQAKERDGYWRTNERGAMRKGLQQIATKSEWMPGGTRYTGKGWTVELLF